MNCAICGKPITMRESNNPEGAMWKDQDGNIVKPEFGPEDRCCNFCNQKYVIPGRMYKLYHKDK